MMMTTPIQDNGELFAEVIINQHSRELDTPFSYKIPEGMSVHVGDVVVVSFGIHNKTCNGFVVGIKKSPPKDVTRIKSVMGIAPVGRVFDEKSLALINFCREKYLCTYSEAISVLVPSGAVGAYAEFIGLVTKEGLTGKKKELADWLEELGGRVEAKKLIQEFGSEAKKIISALIKSNNLKRVYEKRSKAFEKYQNAVQLSDIVPGDNEFSRSKKQQAVYEIMKDAKLLSVQDLKLFSECDSSVINALVKKGFLEKTKVLVDRNPINRYIRADAMKELTLEQKNAVGKINQAIDENQCRSFLLHGVTGSGKTEVFLHCIYNAIKQGKQAIVLVPEISLTPQTVSRFTARFGEQVAVFHSNLSDGERYDQWRKMRDGTVSIVVGARSAVFAPFKNVGIIIIDEEHSDTYKSEMSPRYDTKEIASYRAVSNNGVLVLASATPSFTTYYSAEIGKLELLSMTKRFNENAMPAISVVDMREELAEGNRSMFSVKLAEEIKANIERGEQTILFLNRRGFSTFVSCRECGYVAHCPNCNISLTYHKNDNTLCCHYCGYTISNFEVCPDCGGKYIRYFGTGTEKIEYELKDVFPGCSVIRMDIDTTGKKQSHEEILESFEKDKIDILVGTQMVTKGLDFENVTLVGVITADSMLHFDDYRSGERTFNILEQVTGRAGRGSKPGRAVIQTYSPNHEAISAVVFHDYLKYYNEEIAMRKALLYPPFCEMVLIGFTGKSKLAVAECADSYKGFLKSDKFELLGPIPSKVSKIKNKYRWQIIIKVDKFEKIKENLLEAQSKCRENDNYNEVSIIIDRNPIHIM